MRGKLILMLLFSVIIDVLFLNSCVTKTQEPVIPTNTSTIIPTDTPEPTSTSTATETLTPTPEPIDGRLFFDMNGSGLQDETSFNYDSSRMTDPLQPLHPDLHDAIETYLQANPETQDGDLITIEEPGLSGYEVCAGDECTVTDESGDFVISNPKNNRSILITISDPNEGNPALEMRYINQWKKAVTVPEYTKEIDETTMSTLEIVPVCDEDAEALVCKQDEDTLLVREQYLNDTSIIPISEEYDLINERVNEIGLMQGGFTGPFFSEDMADIYIWGYFDVLHSPDVCDGVGGINPDGKQLSYDGRFNTDGGFDSINPLIGVGDGHLGYDFRVPVGTVTMNAGPTGSVSFADIRTNGEVFVILHYEINSEPLGSYYGHLATSLVSQNEKILRGQVVGLTDHSGDSPYHQLHWDLSTVFNNFSCTKYLPVFYSNVSGIDPSIAKQNHWTVFNLISYK